MIKFYNLKVMNLTTYNVLANSMSDERFFKVEDRSVLSLEKRMPKILEKLEVCFKRRDIICLQEVDVKLAAAGLHQQFIKNGYYALTAHYSTIPGTDHFGNVIAFPLEKYSLVNYGQCKIGDFISRPSQILESDAEVYKKANKRDNALLYAVFKDKFTNREFVVNNYHMPCIFWWPPVMTLHVEALLRKVKELSRDLPFILMGDFNILPGTDLYNFITTGTISDPDNIPSSSWIHQPVFPLIDIRKICNHPFLATNYSRNSRDCVFKGAIDHIFCSPGFLDHSIFYDEPTEEMPNHSSGSDHVPVSCFLKLK